MFGVIFLDNQHRARSSAELFTGTVDAASVYPRVVVKKALAENAAAVIFYHNHPSAVFFLFDEILMKSVKLNSLKQKCSDVF